MAVIAVLADTHGRRDVRLEGRAREAVSEATLVLHAGDLTTAAVLSALEEASDRLVAVHGNADEAAVREELPESVTVDIGGTRVHLVHGHRHTGTGLALAAREAEADLAVAGHTHQPQVVDTGDVLLLNPGSHAEPRGSIRAHAELELVGEGVEGRIVANDGGTVEEFAV